SAVGLNDGNSFQGRAAGTTLEVRPGVYLLTRAGITTHWSRTDKWRHIALREFVAPEASLDRTYVLHRPAGEATAGRVLRVTATVATAPSAREVELVAYLPPARVTPGEHLAPG